MDPFGAGGEGAGGVPQAPEGPEGQELLKPLKGFVLKTWERTPGKKDFDREKGKVFINVCSNEDIEPPSCTDVRDPASGRMGQVRPTVTLSLSLTLTLTLTLTP